MSLPVFLQRRIHFREALAEDSVAASAFSYTSRKRKSEPDGNGFKGATTELFPMDRIRDMMLWQRIGGIGPGLSNLGNTCFLNSVLQCLTYTPPLANYLLSGEHGKKCRVQGFCLVCEFERHASRMLVNREKHRVVAPNGTVAHLKWIAKHMRVGRQEDSHEFLRFVVEGMQRSLLAGVDGSKLEARTKETTLVHQVFGGYLQSRVKCLSCSHVSSTFDALLDLSLEVRQAESIDRALRGFVQPERLCKGNRYRCEHCGNLSDADKAMSVYRAPNILTIHLKRFHMSPYGETSKISKHIQFSADLDLAPYVTGERDNLHYDLYAVLVHEGQTCNSGHYHAFVKASNGIWHSMNDSSVHQVSLATVLKQRAYLLFYARRPQAGSASSDGTKEAAAEGVVPAKRADSVSVPAKHHNHANVPTEHQKHANVLIRSPPTPPATPEPEAVKEEEQQEQDLSPPTEIISNSMWHLTKPSSFDLSDFDAPLGRRRRSRPYAAWTVRAL